MISFPNTIDNIILVDTKHNDVCKYFVENVCIFWKIKGKHTVGGLDGEMMGLIGAGNNPMVGMTVAVEEAMK